MSSIIDGFLLSLSYFSIIAVRLKEFKSSKMMYGSMLFSFPLVGLILSILTLFSYFILSKAFSNLYAGFLSAIIYLILYGFIHLEAVCDVVDGWFALLSNKDLYSIMKEPHIGAIGAIGVFIVILLKVAIITYLFYYQKYWVFIFGVVFSRLYLLYLLQVFTFHKNSTLLRELQNSLSLFFVIFTFILYLLLFSYFVGVTNILILFSIGILVTSLIAKYLLRKFGFLNGDCIGFNIEITEIVLFNIGVII